MNNGRQAPGFDPSQGYRNPKGEMDGIGGLEAMEMDMRMSIDDMKPTAKVRDSIEQTEFNTIVKS